MAVPCTVTHDELGLDLPLPQLSGHDFEADCCSATASPSPAQEEPVESTAPRSQGESKTPALPLKPGQPHVLYLLLCLSSLLSSPGFVSGTSWMQGRDAVYFLASAIERHVCQSLQVNFFFNIILLAKGGI